MASGLKGSTQPGANTDTTIYTVSGSACVVNISACNTHASKLILLKFMLFLQDHLKVLCTPLKRMLN